MYYVYVLLSLKDRELYIGYSTDVYERFEWHKSGRVTATTNRRPLELIYFESYLNEEEAKRREKYLKGGNGRDQLKKQLDITLKKVGYKHL